MRTITPRGWGNAMEPHDAARATASAIGELGGSFMADAPTYARGAELGFSGSDFYILGRGGVLGDTHPDVVSAAFFYWNPDHVRAQWDSARRVMDPSEAAVEWAAVCAAYGEAHLPDEGGLDRLAELCERVVDGASPSGAALFAGWRALDRPAADRPKARVQHLLNALRELRGALHGGAVLAAGLSGRDAMAFRAPQVAPMFGWDPEALPERAEVKERWKQAEAGTDRAFGLALAVLTDDERDELVEMLTTTHAAFRAAKEA